jgi:hypothetical protein
LLPKNLPPKNGISARRIRSRRDFGATILDTIHQAEIIELVCSAGHASIAEGSPRGPYAPSVGLG